MIEYQLILPVDALWMIFPFYAGFVKDCLSRRVFSVMVEVESAMDKVAHRGSSSAERLMIPRHLNHNLSIKRFITVGYLRVWWSVGTYYPL